MISLLINVSIIDLTISTFDGIYFLSKCGTWPLNTFFYTECFNLSVFLFTWLSKQRSLFPAPRVPGQITVGNEPREPFFSFSYFSLGGKGNVFFLCLWPDSHWLHTAFLTRLPAGPTCSAAALPSQPRHVWGHPPWLPFSDGGMSWTAWRATSEPTMISNHHGGDLLSPAELFVWCSSKGRFLFGTLRFYVYLFSCVCSFFFFLTTLGGLFSPHR